VLAQTHNDFELLLYNPEHRPPDDKRITVLRGKPLPPAGAYNLLISKSNGHYIAINDHDDIMMPERLALQAAYLDGHSQEYGIAGKYTYYNSDTGESRRPLHHTPTQLARFILPRRNIYAHSTVMWRKLALFGSWYISSLCADLLMYVHMLEKYRQPLPRLKHVVEIIVESDQQLSRSAQFQNDRVSAKKVRQGGNNATTKP